MRKSISLFVALLMLCTLLPMGVTAAPTAYFSAVNDTLLELNGETMPLWSNGRLYIAYSSAWKTDLGISYSYNKSTKKAVFYQHQKFLLCDFEKNAITDNEGGSYSGTPLERGGQAFVPVNALVEYFDLDYSYTKIDHGYLVRIKSEEVVLSDERFIEAATAPMRQRYERYVKSLEEQSEGPQQEVTDNPGISERRESEAYLALNLTNAVSAGRVLDAFGSSRQLTLILSDASFENADDLLRRAVAMGNSIALCADASLGADAVKEQIVALNERLWTSANVKTRFVYLPNADEDATLALTEAGYCCISFAVDLSKVNDSARIASRILSAAESRGYTVALLGDDIKMENRASTVLRALREGNCRSLKLRETAL